MPGSAKFHCFATLLNLGDHADHHNAPEVRYAPEVRRAIDKALSCDRMVCCGQRLGCAWLAAELAGRLGRRR